MLTDKTLEDFENWFDVNYEWMPLVDSYETDFYNSLEFEMQYGVYVDFFDEKDIYVDVRYNEIGRNFYYSISTKPMQDDIILSNYKNRQEARKEAIQKANIYYNQNNK